MPGRVDPKTLRLFKVTEVTCRSHDNLTASCCISFDSAASEEHNDTILEVLDVDVALHLDVLSNY